MYPGNTDVIKCPSCGTLQKRETLASGNTCGAVYYSDGQMDAPMLKAYPYFVQCPSCGVFLKLNKEVVIGEIPVFLNDWSCEPNIFKIPMFLRGITRYMFPKWSSTSYRKPKCAEPYKSEWLNAPYGEFLNIDGYCQAIEKGLYNSGSKDSEEWKGDILSLRIMLWRAFNDRNRIVKNEDWEEFDHDDGIGDRDTKTRQEGTKMNEEEQKVVYDANCRAILAAMADAHDDESLLVRAELHRNLGEFDQCVDLLNQIKDQNEYRPYIASIRKACTSKNTLTVPVIDWEDIFEAAQYGDVQDVKYLIEKGIDVNVKDYCHGFTPLDVAKGSRRTEVVEYLESIGAKSGDELP